MEKQNVLVYIRTSKNNEKELKEKKQMIREFAENNNLNIDKEFIDVNVPFSLSNKELKNMLFESNKNKNILVYSIIDISRKYEDLYLIMNKYGLKIRSCRTTLSGNTLSHELNNKTNNTEVV